MLGWLVVIIVVVAIFNADKLPDLKKAIEAKTSALKKEEKSTNDVAIATDKLNSEVTENNELMSKSITPKGIVVDTSDTYKSLLENSELAAVMKGVDLNSLTKGLNIEKEKRDEINKDLIDLLSTVSKMAKVQLSGNRVHKGSPTNTDVPGRYADFAQTPSGKDVHYLR